MHLRTYKLPKSGAILSRDKRYRYVLARRVGSSPRAVTFVMLNPSTADETRDDNTITWCKRFAELQGYGQLYVTNLSPLRATHPRDMLEAGPESPQVWKRNIGWVLKAASESELVLLAWGNMGARTDRASKVLTALRREGYEVYCLEVTDKQHPRHPRGFPHGHDPILFSSP